MGDGIRDDFQVGPPEHDQAKAEHRKTQEDTYDPGAALKDALEWRKCWNDGGDRWGKQAGRGQGSHLSIDLSTVVSYLSSEREHIARHHCSRMDHGVSPYRHQIADQPAVDIGGAVNYQQVSSECLRGSQVEVSLPGSPTCYGDPQISATWTKHRYQPVLDCRRMAEIPQVHDRATLRSAVKQAANVADEIDRGGGETIERTVGVKWGRPQHRDGRQRENASIRRHGPPAELEQSGGDAMPAARRDRPATAARSRARGVPDCPRVL